MFSLIYTLEKKASESCAGKTGVSVSRSSEKKKVDSISVNDPDEEDVVVC